MTLINLFFEYNGKQVLSVYILNFKKKKSSHESNKFFKNPAHKTQTLQNQQIYASTSIDLIIGYFNFCFLMSRIPPKECTYASVWILSQISHINLCLWDLKAYSSPQKHISGKQTNKKRADTKILS